MIPFVSFVPLEKEIEQDLRAAFERVLENSWYIQGKEDEKFEEHLVNAINEAILEVNKCTQQELQDILLSMGE